MFESQEPNECYTLKEASQVLRVTRQTINNWRKKGILKVARIGRKTLIRKDEVSRILKENEKN